MQFNISSFYNSIPDSKLRPNFPLLEDLIIEGLGTSRKARLKVKDLFLKLNPTLQLPSINLSELELCHESRQFIIQTLDQSPVQSALKQEFCRYINKDTDRIVTGD